MTLEEILSASIILFWIGVAVLVYFGSE